MIQLRIASKYEDRMTIAIRNFCNQQIADISIKDFNSLDVEKEYVDYLINTSYKLGVQKLLSFVEETQDIMGIPIVFRFVKDEKEAYTDFSKETHHSIRWNTFVSTSVNLKHILC